MELNAFQLLAEKYHFTYNAIDANGSYGRKEGDAWLGSIGYLVNQVMSNKISSTLFRPNFSSHRQQIYLFVI